MRGKSRRWWVACAVVVLASCTSPESSPQSTEPILSTTEVSPSAVAETSVTTTPNTTATSRATTTTPPTTAATAQDPAVPYAGNAGYDVEHYQWDLTIEPDNGSLQAHGIIDAVATADLKSVSLDYASTPLRAIAVNGEEVNPSYTPTKLVIDAVVDAGERFTISYDFDGTPELAVAPGRAGRFGWIAQEGTVHTEVLLPGDMATILPLNDTPHDPASYEINMTVPTGFVATASGTLVKVRDEGDAATYSWRMELPVTEVTLAVDKYVVESVPVPPDLGVEISAALPPESLARLEHLEVVPEMIQFLEERVGAFPFDELGFTFVSNLGGSGGDSTPARIHIYDFSPVALVHELAHQWMGGKVGTASTSDSWLREGFCVYMEWLWLDTNGESDVDRLAAEAQAQLGPETRPPIEISQPSDRGDVVTYERGALVMYSLHRQLGDEQFWSALTTFFDEFAGKSATTNDFISTVERVTDQELGEFFDAWLREAAVPPLPTS